jgi:hypothetical protein
VEKQAIPTTSAVAPGSRDGIGAGDHDAPYRFGSRPSSAWTYPFTAMQYTRLLLLRGLVVDGAFADDRARA